MKLPLRHDAEAPGLDVLRRAADAAGADVCSYEVRTLVTREGTSHRPISARLCCRTCSWDWLAAGPEDLGCPACSGRVSLEVQAADWKIVDWPVSEIAGP